MTEPLDTARKILALVDEYPSEPFSFERKQVENRIADMIFQHTQQTEDELDEAFALGQDAGYREGKEETEDELHEEIQDLEDRINELEREIEDLKADNDRSFAEGYETASKEVNVIETLNFK